LIQLAVIGSELLYLTSLKPVCNNQPSSFVADIYSRLEGTSIGDSFPVLVWRAIALLGNINHHFLLKTYLRVIKCEALFSISKLIK